VKTLASEGQNLRRGHERLGRLEEVTTPEVLSGLQEARRVLEAQWPVLLGDDEPDYADLEPVAETLRERLGSETLFEHLAEIRQAAAQIAATYTKLYQVYHERRGEAYAVALDEVKGLFGSWSDVAEWARDLTNRAGQTLTNEGHQLDLPPGADVCGV